jgi:hypothetical protein
VGSFAATDSKASTLNGAGKSAGSFSFKERIERLAKHFGVKDVDKLPSRDRGPAIKKAAGTDTFEAAWAKYEKDIASGKSLTVTKPTVVPLTASKDIDEGDDDDEGHEVATEGQHVRVDGARIIVNAAPIAQSDAPSPELIVIATKMWHGVLTLLAGAALWALLGGAIIRMTGGH